MIADGAQLLSQDAQVAVTTANLLDLLDLERLDISNRLSVDPKRRADLGQFFTPSSVATFMASMLEVPNPPKELRILDPGGGSGVLMSAAVVELCTRAENKRPAALHATVWEIDELLSRDIARTFEYCFSVCREVGVSFKGTLRQGNFILDAPDFVGDCGLFGPEDRPRFHVAIMNPPYRKLRSDSPERARLSTVGIETSNMYSAFVWLAIKLLEEDGELVAITPRSFMNGPYFRPFRQVLAHDFTFRQVHVYDARDTAFLGDKVLQENVIFHGIQGRACMPIKITTSRGPDDSGLVERMIEPEDLIHPADKEFVFHVVSDETDARISQQMRALPNTLAELVVSVSTGRVVGFRSKECLHAETRPGDAPLIFPRHFADGFVSWPDSSDQKPNGLAVNGPNDELLLPSGWYVLINRFSAKEEKRRVVAGLYDPARIASEVVAFDNKLNVLHRENAGLPEGLAKGLAVFLNSTAVDAYFRQFSGHTQVNATDLRALRFPDAEDLERLGGRIDGSMPPQDEINQIVREEIAAMSEGDDPVEVKRRVQASIGILKSLQAPRGQTNDRSALTLLGLLDLAPADSWSMSSAPLRGVTELMDWIAANYGRKYAPNTRETIRRFTLHQFIEMGLVLLNPDNPARPPNSPNNVYQIEPSALELLRCFETDAWDSSLFAYLKSMAGKNRLLEKARLMEHIPVTLPDGKQLELTAGGQNILVKEIIEQFTPRFTPGGHVIYVGDAGEKHLLYDVEYLKSLGVEIDPHSKMPDAVVHYVERNWLVLIEAVTSHGPINVLRHNQLKDLFAGSTVGLVFVTTFLDRATMREYLPEIAWETEVWVADAPDHLIHFNGERFLGPYETDA